MEIGAANIVLKVVSVGNSKGVRLPSEILRRHHIVDEVELIETPDGILLRSKLTNKLSFEAAFGEMAKDQEALADIVSLYAL